MSVANRNTDPGLRTRASSVSVVGEMNQKVNENFELRRNKMALAAKDEKTLARAAKNADFFSEVEGLFALSRSSAVGGLYVATKPRLHLARI